MATQADGAAERDAALLMLDGLRKERSRRRITVGADKVNDTKDFVSTVRELGITPHVHRTGRIGGAQSTDGPAPPGYEISLSKRCLVEKPFGWLKQSGH